MKASFAKTAALLCLVAALGGCGQQKEPVSSSSVAELEQEVFVSQSSTEEAPLPETIVGTTPSGNFTVLLAGSTSGGDGYIDELVSRNNQTGEIVELGMMSSPQTYILQNGMC